MTVNGKTGTSATDFTVPTGTSGSVTATGSLRYGRAYHTATLLADGRVLVTGGYVNDGMNASCEIYDPTTRTWALTGSLKNPRAYHKAFLLKNGKVLVMGGIPHRIEPKRL